MKTKVTTCIVVALMLLSGVSQAQQRNRAQRMQKTMIKLTDAQKEELKVAKVQFAKATIDVKNELNELHAFQRTLMSAEKLDEKKVFENIDKMSALKKQLMEERINMRLATSGLLDGKQRLNRDMKMNHRKMKGKHMNRRKGQMQKNGRSGFSNQRFDRGACTMNLYRNCCSGINSLGLSDAQQEKMKIMKVAHVKASQNLREEMQELRLKQKHLLNDEDPNKNQIFSNLDRVSVIQNQLAKERVASQKEIRNILDEDQLVLFLSRPHKMNKMRRKGMHRAFN